MKIVSLAVYQADLPLVDGDYCWADGKSVSVYDSTVVAVTTDTGITGYGEVVPLGPNYLASYADGVRAGIKELGPKLLGQDPTQLSVLNAYMDYHLKGHPYVKSGLDMACWDILGKVRRSLRKYSCDIFMHGIRRATDQTVTTHPITIA